ncbi:MAG TPA: hypothetical protein VEI02_13240, partial [Planctomycetota bacterium]|nr:hypothetical protein [Planctomycetota bacterium]
MSALRVALALTAAAAAAKTQDFEALVLAQGGGARPTLERTFPMRHPEAPEMLVIRAPNAADRFVPAPGRSLAGRTRLGLVRLERGATLRFRTAPGAAVDARRIVDGAVEPFPCASATAAPDGKVVLPTPIEGAVVTVRASGRRDVHRLVDGDGAPLQDASVVGAPIEGEATERRFRGRCEAPSLVPGGGRLAAIPQRTLTLATTRTPEGEILVRTAAPPGALLDGEVLLD